MRQHLQKFKEVLFSKAYVLETLITLMAIQAFNVAFLPEDLGFKEASLHPYWIVVLFIPTRYGFRAGLFSAVIAVVFYLNNVMGGIPNRLALEQAGEAGLLWLPLSFLGIGMLLGEVRQKYLNDEIVKDELIEENRDAIKKLHDSLDASERARHVLEARIVGQSSTVKTLYEAALKLESLVVTDIYKGCLEILGKHLSVKKSSIYTKEGDEWVLKSSWGWEEGKAVEGRVRYGDSLMHIAEKEKRPLTVRDFLDHPEINEGLSQYGEVKAIVPLKDLSGEIQAMVNIEDIDFLDFNKVNLELINLVVDWTSHALRNVKVYDQIKARLVFDENKRLFQYSFLEFELKRECVRARAFKLDLCLTLVKVGGFGFLEQEKREAVRRALEACLMRSFPETDVICNYRIDGTYAIISPSRSKEVVGTDVANLMEQSKAINVDITTSCEAFDPVSDKDDALLSRVLAGLGMKIK